MSKREGKNIKRFTASSREKKSLTSLALTAFIIFALILSGPAVAVNVSISNFPSSIAVGDEVNFLLNVAIDAGENIPISNITLFIKDNSNGAIVDTFSFYPNGVIITPSSGLTVDVLDSSGLNYTYGDRSGYGYGNHWYGYGYGYSFYDTANFGYGYGYGVSYGYGYGYSSSSGYGYGYNTLLQTNLTYNITISCSITQTYSAGDYTIQAYVYTGEDNVLQAFLSGETLFTVTGASLPSADIYVDDDDDTCGCNSRCFDRIWKGVRNATDGETVYIAAGTYNDSVDINKSVSLVGAGSNVTKVNFQSASGRIHVFDVSASDASISGLNISGGSSCIFMNRSNYSRIFNNTISRCDYGIYSNFSNNNTFSNNLLFQTTFEGMYITRYSNSNVIKNNIARFNGLRGIFLELSSNNTLLNNTAVSNQANGIILDVFSNNNTVMSNNASGNVDTFGDVHDDTGIFLNQSNYNLVINNTANSNDGYGIVITSSIGNNITNNTINSNVWEGLQLYNSNNSNIIGNNVHNHLNNSFLLWFSNGNTLMDNNASNSTAGTYLISSNSNTIINITEFNNSLSGIYLRNSNGSIIRKSKLKSINRSGIYIWDSSSNYLYDNFLNNTINTKFFGVNLSNDWNRTKIAGNNIINKPLIGGNFWAKPDGSGTSQTCLDDNGDGICDSSFMLAANNNDYLPLSINSSVLTVCASGLGCNFTTIQGAVDNSSDGKMIIVQAGTYNENVDVNKSLELLGAGSKVTFVNATSPSDHTFNLTATSTNLSGFTILNATDLNFAGIYVQANNATISNNNISSNYFGIRIVLANGSVIQNNNVSMNNRSISLLTSSGNQIINNSASHNTAVGISLFTSSNYNTVTNNTVNNNVGNGIHIDGSDFNFLRYNKVNSNSQYAIFIRSSNSTSIKDSNASMNNNGIFLESSNHSTITNNNASKNNVYGISGFSSINITIINNTASSNIGSGIYLISSSNGTLIDNTANSNLDVGIYFISSINLTVINNSANSNQDRGIRFDYSNMSEITNNIFNDNGWGIHAFKSHNNTINNNIANSNDDYGIRLCFSENSTVESNIANSNDFGIRLCLHSHNNNVIDNIAKLNTYYGLEFMDSTNITAINNTLESSLYGISFEASNNTIAINNTMRYNGFGAYVNSSTNNTFYNNLFLNINNIRFVDRIYNNTWNTTRTTQTNIVNGTIVGGNFWAYPNGTGFSQQCTDADVDGICDSSYNLTSRNTDYLPLSIPVDFSKPAVENLNVSPSNIIQINRNITISANITDDYSVGAARINITTGGYAVGTGNELMLLNSSTGFYEYEYNISQYGKHTALINATDLSGKYNDSTSIDFYAYLAVSNSTSISANASVIVINESNILEIIATSNESGSGSISINATILPVVDGTFASIGINSTNSNAEIGVKYLNITNSTSLANVSNLTIRLHYSDTEISDITESSLAIYYFNGSQWFKCSDYTGGNIDNNSAYPYVFDAGLNTTNKFAYATIDHFSLYTMAGTLISIPAVAVPGVGGGGGGGAGKIVGKIKVISESTISFLRILAGKTAWGIFSERTSPIISSIRVTVRNDVEFVSFTLKYLLERPKETPEIDRLVKGYIWITKNESLKDLDIKKAVINFRLEKEWLADNDVDINTVTLLRYMNDKWQVVDTEPLIQDKNYIYFKSDTPGFSYFAFTGSANSGYEFSLATLKEQTPLYLFDENGEPVPLTPQIDVPGKPEDKKIPDIIPIPTPPRPINTFLTTLLILLLGSGAAYFYWKSLNR